MTGKMVGQLFSFEDLLLRGMEQAMRGEEGLACFLSWDGARLWSALGRKPVKEPAAATLRPIPMR